jgi:3-deoxy-D-manno-octulosonate 8-phosphate phosphatase (KDO 8-P phosphatase)
MVRHRIHYLGITDYYAKVHQKLEKFEEFKQNTISKTKKF